VGRAGENSNVLHLEENSQTVQDRGSIHENKVSLFGTKGGDQNEEERRRRNRCVQGPENEKVKKGH